MHVLFVEDDPMNRAVVRDMLTTVDVAMAEAEDAETGLGMIDSRSYDIILMDLRMPGMDGLAAIREVRGRPDAKCRTPIIVITADTAPDLHARCFASGADRVLGKPVAMDGLFDAISEVVGERGDIVI